MRRDHLGTRKVASLICQNSFFGLKWSYGSPMSAGRWRTIMPLDAVDSSGIRAHLRPPLQNEQPQCSDRRPTVLANTYEGITSP